MDKENEQSSTSPKNGMRQQQQRRKATKATPESGIVTQSEVSEDPLKQLCSLDPKKIPDFVSKNKGVRLSLNAPHGAKLKIAAVDDTVYRYDPDEVNGWGMFYLPEIVTMHVIGVVEDKAQYEELVLMVCEEDKHIYACDEDYLHQVALNMEELCKVGIKYPGNKTYYKGEAFKDMSKEDWEDVKKGEVGKKLDEEHKTLVAMMRSSFLKNLK